MKVNIGKSRSVRVDKNKSVTVKKNQEKNWTENVNPTFSCRKKNPK